MTKRYILTICTCIVMLALFLCAFRILYPATDRSTMKVGFIFDNDESTPYTYNFSLGMDALEKEYGERVEILTHSNVLDDQMEGPLRDLAEEGCNIIFFNGYSPLVMELAPEYPDIQFCQTSYMDMNGVTTPANYHTFKGEAYQGRYVSGIAAGMKIGQLIDDGLITVDQAKVGFVAAFPTSEVISGYTAFLLGVRAIVPETTMEVCYTHTWSSYALEKSAAKQLIADGCVILSQHTDTIGPAIACEEASETMDTIFFVGNNQSMSEIAPGTSLVTSRICWEPYILGAVKAVMSNQEIEKNVSGKVHGSDISAGFEKGWVEMVDLNMQVAAPGTKQAMDGVIDQFKKGSTDFVFRGNYVGVDPDDPADTINLTTGYKENANTSYPLFHYVLQDVITVVEPEE
ncbi:MAG: BMP family ABC transporter substrate-binding protein [Lachnospiraceae bacterium]|nr:BMP family ABC transporter substrate-binding protein [Lachnospiraceae bacterium]